jgi:hypothetical protein
MHGDSRGANRVSVIKPEENRPLGRPRHRREANVKVCVGGTDLSHMAQDRGKWWDLVNVGMNL